VTTHRNTLAILALAAVAAAPAPARAAGLKHERSVYQDEKESPLKAPEGVACTEKGAIVVADTGNGRLLTYTFKDGKLAGGTPIRLAEATYPLRVQIDGKGNVLVLDGRTRRIVRVDPEGKFAGAVEWRGAAGAAAMAPIAFKVDPAGNLHVLDISARRVLVAEGSGKVVREIPLPKEGEFTDVAADAGGRILVVDSVGSRLWMAEKGGKEFKPIGAGMKDRVSFPIYLAEESGKLYLVDQNGSGIVMLGVDGNFLGRELEMGSSDGTLYYPAQMCVNAEGLVVIADRNNNRVQVFSVSR
jgi:sugar lactone lactonase YvrE